MLLNAITLELATLLRAQARGLIISPLAVENPEEFGMGRDARYIYYGIIPNTVSPFNYFAEKAQDTTETFILIKTPGRHLRVISLTITGNKIRIYYWRGYGWGNYADKYGAYITKFKPRTDDAKRDNQHIMQLKPIWKGHKQNKSWHPIKDKLDLSTNDYTEVVRIILTTIKQSHTLCKRHRKSEQDFSAMVIADTGTVFEVDTFNNCKQW